jgi:hypothetical protein
MTRYFTEEFAADEKERQRRQMQGSMQGSMHKLPRLCCARFSLLPILR